MCLSHLAAHTSGLEWELVLVDNASSDGTRQWLETHAPAGATTWLLDENLGWVASLNLVLERVRADYYFFLNPDAFVEPNWLAPLVAALQAEPGVGFATPKFRYPDGRIHYAGAYIGSSLSVRVTGHDEADDGRFDTAGPVPFGHGMSLVRREVVDAVGPLDTGFGLGYFEEVDYQLRARRHGFSVVYVPTSVIVHATSKAFDLHPGGYKEELLTRNWLRVMALHWPLSWLALRVPVELLRPVRALLAGADTRPGLRGLWGFARGLGAVAARRQSLRREGPCDLQALRRQHRAGHGS